MSETRSCACGQCQKRMPWGGARPALREQALKSDVTGFLCLLCGGETPENCCSVALFHAKLARNEEVDVKSLKQMRRYKVR